MYVGPIVRTYYSNGQYQQDAAIMASYGYQPINVEQEGITNGLALTLILIFGLLLTPACIGLVILCFLPTAFSKRLNVSYVRGGTGALQYAPQQMLPPGYSQPLYPPSQPFSQPLYPPSQPMPQPSSQQWLPQPTLPAQSAPPSGYLRALPQPDVPLSVRMQEGMASLKQMFDTWRPWQQALVIIGLSLVVIFALVGVVFVILTVL